MKNLSECELAFKELNEIPRSSRQKQQTFQKIMSEISRNHDTKRQYLPKFLTCIVSLAACFLFVFIIFTSTNLNNNASLITSMEGKEIIQMGLASSQSETSFIPVEGERQKNTFLINDDKWGKMVSEMIKNAQISTIKPVSNPSYDLLLTLKGTEIIKIKVWEEERKVYLKELNEDAYYYVPKEKSGVFFEYINSLHNYIESP